MLRLRILRVWVALPGALFFRPAASARMAETAIGAPLEYSGRIECSLNERNGKMYAMLRVCDERLAAATLFFVE